jgi:hypothetical protein
MGLLTVRSALLGQGGSAAQRARKALERSAWVALLLNPMYLRLHPANEEEADIPSVARTEKNTLTKIRWKLDQIPTNRFQTLHRSNSPRYEPIPQKSLPEIDPNSGKSRSKP